MSGKIIHGIIIGIIGVIGIIGELLYLNIQYLLYSQQMENLKNSESRIFIMNVHSGYAEPILQAAEEFGLIGPEYAWIVTDGTIRDAVSITSITQKIF